MKLFSEEEGAEERRNDLAKRVKEVMLRELGKEDEVREEVLREEYLLAVVDALKVSRRELDLSLVSILGNEKFSSQSIPPSISQDRLHTINDIPALGRYFFLPPSYDTPVSQKLYKSMNPQTYRSSLPRPLCLLSK